MPIRFSLKALGLVIALGVLITAAHYALAFFDASQREVLATLLGAAATIFAGWLAWESAIETAGRTLQEKAERAAARKEYTVVALAQPIHATSAWFSLLTIGVSTRRCTTCL